MKKIFFTLLFWFVLSFAITITAFTTVTRPPTHPLSLPYNISFKNMQANPIAKQLSILKTSSQKVTLAKLTSEKKTTSQAESNSQEKSASQTKPLSKEKSTPKAGSNSQRKTTSQIKPISQKKSNPEENLTPEKKEVERTKIPKLIGKQTSLKIIPLTKSTSHTALSGTMQTLTMPNTNWSAQNPIAIDIGKLSLTSLAMRWDKGRLYYSFSSTNKLENDWQEVKPNGEGPVPEDYIMSEMIFPPKKMKYLLIKSDDILKTWQLDTINVSAKKIDKSQGKLTVKGIYNRNSGAQYSSLNIITRDQWGANPANWDTGSHKNKNIDDPQRFVWKPEYYRASRIVVHHTVSSNTPANSTVVVRAIYLYHAYSLGWGDIGYNYLIDNNGNIYEGKGGGDETLGYHAYLQANSMSIGIGMIGNFTYRNPTSAAQASLKKIMAERAAFYNFNLSYNGGSLAQWKNTNSTVFGHRDSWLWCHANHPLSYLCPNQDKWIVNATACPGNNFYPRLKQLTREAQAYKNANFGQIKNVVTTVNSLLAKDNSSNKFLVVYNLPKETVATNIKNLVPAFSGISQYEVFNNIVIYSVFDWNNGGVVPPRGWTGFYPNTFFPPSNGPNDRIRTLMKIFALDPQVKFVSLILPGKFALQNHLF